MNHHAQPEPDLMPPPFAEGLDDWSRGDGTPDGPTWETAGNARLAREDGDFGTCLELRTVEAVERVRYMGEVPLLPGAFIEVAARVKAVRGPLPALCVAAWPGGALGQGVDGLPAAGPRVDMPAHGGVCEIRAVIGRDRPARGRPRSGTSACSTPTSGSTSRGGQARWCASRASRCATSPAASPRAGRALPGFEPAAEA